MIEQFGITGPSKDFAIRAADRGGAFCSLFEASPCGLILLDEAGRIVQVNSCLQAIFAYRAEELLGQPIEILLPQRDRAQHVGLRNGFLSDPASRTMAQGRDLSGLRKDGVEVPVEVALNYVDLPQGRMVCALVNDITQRKRAEWRLREAHDQLEEFTHVASHDLRSPLRGIAHLIDFIEEDYGESAPPEVRRNLARMAERVRAMERLIEDLLIYARAGRHKAEPEMVDLRTIVQEAIDLEGPDAHVHFAIDIALEPFETLRVPLATVLRNLISNAIKHHDRQEKNIAIRARSQGNMCVVDVCDDGPGIAQAAQARAFRLFQTASSAGRRASGAGPAGTGKAEAGTASVGKAESGNSGLGLALAKRLVEAQGGRIELICDGAERGCHFRIHWPRFARSDLDG